MTSWEDLQAAAKEGRLEAPPLKRTFPDDPLSFLWDDFREAKARARQDPSLSPVTVLDDEGASLDYAEEWCIVDALGYLLIRPQGATESLEGNSGLAETRHLRGAL